MKLGHSVSDAEGQSSGRRLFHSQWYSVVCFSGEEWWRKWIRCVICPPVCRQY